MATRTTSYDRSLVQPSAPSRLWAALRLIVDAYRDALAMAHEAQRRGTFME
jgi:hypothetical protein